MPDGHDTQQPRLTPFRRNALMKAATEQGLLVSEDRTIGGRVPDALLQAAKRNSGISETTELLTYALVQVALGDNFGEKPLALQGTLAKDVLFAG